MGLLDWVKKTVDDVVDAAEDVVNGIKGTIEDVTGVDVDQVFNVPPQRRTANSDWTDHFNYLEKGKGELDTVIACATPNCAISVAENVDSGYLYDSLTSGKSQYGPTANPWPNHPGRDTGPYMMLGLNSDIGPFAKLSAGKFSTWGLAPMVGIFDLETGKWKNAESYNTNGYGIHYIVLAKGIPSDLIDRVRGNNEGGPPASLWDTRTDSLKVDNPTSKITLSRDTYGYELPDLQKKYNRIGWDVDLRGSEWYLSFQFDANPQYFRHPDDAHPTFRYDLQNIHDNYHPDVSRFATATATVSDGYPSFQGWNYIFNSYEYPSGSGNISQRLMGIELPIFVDVFGRGWNERKPAARKRIYYAGRLFWPVAGSTQRRYLGPNNSSPYQYYGNPIFDPMNYFKHESFSPSYYNYVWNLAPGGIRGLNDSPMKSPFFKGYNSVALSIGDNPYMYHLDSFVLPDGWIRKHVQSRSVSRFPLGIVNEYNPNGSYYRWLGVPFKRKAVCSYIDGMLMCDRDPFIASDGDPSPGGFDTNDIDPTGSREGSTPEEKELEDLEEEIQDILETIDEQETTLEEVAAEGRRVVARARVASTKPEYVSFEPADLPKTFIQADASGTITVNRGIFILSHITRAADVDDEKYDSKIDLLDYDPKNFRKCMAPADALKSDALYNGFGSVPFVANRGSTYCNWTTLGISRDVSLKYDNNVPNLKANYSDGTNTTRPPHPLDHVYLSKDDSGVLQFRHLAYHTLNRFLEAKQLPKKYYKDFWATLLANDSIGDWAVDSALTGGSKAGIRSKDLYATLGSFKDFQDIDDTYPSNLERYTVEKSVLPNSIYDGTAAQALRVLPAIAAADQAKVTAKEDHFPYVRYKPCFSGAGAYYVSAEYPPAALTNTDIDPKKNKGFYDAMTKGEAFQSYYHHDQYDVDAKHLQPSAFIYSLITNAKLQPGFAIDGIAGSTGPLTKLNAHKMQLISNTDTTYGALIRRVLPGLGHIARLNPHTQMVDLVDVATRYWPKKQFGEDMIQITGIQYDVGLQYSSYIFENDDMVRGKNTLEEFKDKPLESGRYVIFGSNPFINGKTLIVKTGTWTSRFEDVQTMISLRRDLYSFRISNFHLIEDGKIKGPLIGDRVRLRSRKIPIKTGFVDILITSRSQSELTTDYQGFAFEGAGDQTGEP